MADMSMAVAANYNRGQADIKQGVYGTLEVPLTNEVLFIEQPSTGRMVVRNFFSGKTTEIDPVYRYNVPLLIKEVQAAVEKVA